MANTDDGWRRNKRTGGWFNINWTKDRYVGGKHIKQKNNQSLSDAVKESKKFSKKQDENKEQDYKKKLDDAIKNSKTSTVDADADDSLQVNTDAHGNLTPEREQIHQNIIKKMFEGKTPVSDEEKVFYMTGGGSGTGKSNFVRYSGKYFGKDFKFNSSTEGLDGNIIKIDADELKNELYKTSGDKNPFVASYYHEESSALAKRVQSIGLENGYAVMLDGTGDGGPGSIKSKIDEAHKNGYKVSACYGTCSFEKALNNNLERYNKKASKGDPTARYVSERNVAAIHSKVSSGLKSYAKEFDEIKVYDMEDFNNIKLIATGGNGRDLKAVKGREKEFNYFVKKGEISNEEIFKIADDYKKKIEREGRRPKI